MAVSKKSGPFWGGNRTQVENLIKIIMAVSHLLLFTVTSAQLRHTSFAFLGCGWWLVVWWLVVGVVGGCCWWW